MTTIILRGANITDTCFSFESPDEGEVTWNVTRLQDAADAGRFGAAQEFIIESLTPPDYSKGFLDPERIAWLKKNPRILDIPAIAIASKVAGRLRIFCDGQHRMTARYELKLPTFSTYVVPVDVERRFRITIEER
jgi:hypothetical protein